MALEFMDGFDHYNGGAIAGRKWDTGSNVNSFTAGRFGGNAANLLTQAVVLTLTAQQTRVVGFAFQFTGAGANIVCQFMDSGTNQVELRLDASRHFVVTRNGTVLTTGATVYTLNTWYYVEFKAKIDPATGTYEVRVNGATEITGSGNTRNTANSTCNGLRFGPGAGTNIIDDLYVLNTSGSVNSDFLGECRIITTLPNADNTTTPGTNKTWTPNAGTTHSTQVDETNPNDDTDYISSATAGQVDTFQYPDITATGTIAGVQVNLCDRKDDAGTRTLCAEYRSGAGTNYDGATSISPGSAYLIHRQIWETDPATSAAWTVANINAGEFGVKCVA